MAYITHTESNNGQAPEIGVHTNVGAQYLQQALHNWRKGNPWAAHIPYENLPQQFKDTLELAAGILAGAGHASRYAEAA